MSIGVRDNAERGREPVLASPGGRDAAWAVVHSAEDRTGAATARVRGALVKRGKEINHDFCL